MERKNFKFSSNQFLSHIADKLHLNLNKKETFDLISSHEYYWLLLLCLVLRTHAASQPIHNLLAPPLRSSNQFKLDLCQKMLEGCRVRFANMKQIRVKTWWTRDVSFFLDRKVQIEKDTVRNMMLNVLASNKANSISNANSEGRCLKAARVWLSDISNQLSEPESSSSRSGSWKQPANSNRKRFTDLNWLLLRSGFARRLWKVLEAIENFWIYWRSTFSFLISVCEFRASSSRSCRPWSSVQRDKSFGFGLEYLNWLER